MNFFLINSAFGWVTKTVVVAAVLAHPLIAVSDMVVSAPDGRKILLKDDGTWRVQDASSASEAKPDQGPQADLRLVRKIERGTNCRLAFSLTNNLPYAIGNIVPYIAVFRATDVVHDTQSVAFHTIRPTDKVEREVDFSRITCAEIVRVQVSGGDRCELGELHKFSAQDGQCLARIRVVPSDLARFSK